MRDNNIAAKCIVCPWDDSMMGTIGRKAYMVSLSPGEGVGAVTWNLYCLASSIPCMVQLVIHAAL